MGSSRRGFLAGVVGGLAVLSTRDLLALEGLQAGLDEFGVSGPPCTPDAKPTPALRAEGFKPGSPERIDLRDSGVVGRPVVLLGTVAGVRCGRIAGAVVDIWQADGRGTIDASGFRLRGHQLTTRDGAYRFQTVLPGASSGRAPHFGLRVQPSGKPAFTTEIFLPGDSRNAADPRYQSSLAARNTVADGGETLIFDVLLDL